MTTDGIIVSNVSRGNNVVHTPKHRYFTLNNIALDGFFIGSGKTTTIDRICETLLRADWMDEGKLRGSNLRLLRKKMDGKDTSHYCLVCDDVLAACSLPDKVDIIPSKDSETFRGHNIQNFVAMGSPNVNEESYFVAKINSQNTLNAAYSQLINCGVNEIIATYSQTTFSPNPNHPTNIILLYSREINFAQIQFTLAGVLAEKREIRLIKPHLLERIHRTMIDKPFNFGDIRNWLIVYYDQCHAFYTKGLETRKDYARLCFENICKRNRNFEMQYYESFDFFESFFNFQVKDNNEYVEKILKMIYNFGNDKNTYESYWSHDADCEPNTLSFDGTIEKIVQKITNEISILSIE